ncbi:aldolase catalytic domain-containing protein [Fulvivirga sedimenti]|uniref:Aldolase catalytic domain-containing protein n=1 Tax=Fulvivirga sedimenti TaxID=2879465 RepID=A0A9X1KWN8_9BACT|nr:aldolase catalytic domain-containing protein [Fulvivirga sedimenti]MCA6073427.1 aldolase catalytic domain-containing protein [Fulvivirga sedimenti]
MKLLDCTLRDGGYYTNWDFDQELVDQYILAMNDLPVDYIEVGYRSKPMKNYLGEYFYCPLYLLRRIREKSTKKLTIILNEKDVRAEDVPGLLGPLDGLIDLIRIAVDPKNIGRAIQLAEAIKSAGFPVAFNVMYMSSWKDTPEFIEELVNMDGLATYFYMVDSYGGVYPKDVAETIALVRSKTHVPLGFHGHNNLELGLINTLTALEHGVEIVDATITGMGRGAGNLKTELLLTALSAQEKVSVNYNSLSKAVEPFAKMQKDYEWGTNLPYMVSGANSLPQKDVMSWMGKNRYGLDTIVNALHNQKNNISDNVKLPELDVTGGTSKVLIVGGGTSVQNNHEGLIQLISENDDIAVIFSSSRNFSLLSDHSKRSYLCLIGNEGNKLLDRSADLKNYEGTFIFPPYPREMGTIIPEEVKDRSYELRRIGITDKYFDSPLAVSLQLADDLGASEIFLIGFDGYGSGTNPVQFALAKENQYILDFCRTMGKSVSALAPTAYSNLPVRSLYALLS